MDTAKMLSARVRLGLAARPATPGLVVAAALLVIAAAGRSLGLSGQVWLVLALVMTGSLAIVSGYHEVRRGMLARRHQQRVDTTHELLGVTTDRSEVRLDPRADPGLAAVLRDEIVHPQAPLIEPEQLGTLLGDRLSPVVTGLDEVNGVLHDLGGVVEEFGHRLDGLLREVRAETAPVGPKRRS